MSNAAQMRVAEPWLVEYWKLKDEQISRMEYRDQMLHVHLGLVGVAMGWALAHETRVFLIVPWICAVIGWAYVANDERVSALGKYMREVLAPRAAASGTTEELGWERWHRQDSDRPVRKACQFAVDLLTFVVSGLLALATFLWKTESVSVGAVSLVVLETLMLLGLAVQTWRYAEFRSEPPSPPPAVMR